MGEIYEFPKEGHVPLSEREKSLVGVIEQLPMDDSAKTDLILVWRGLKQATNLGIDIATWRRGEVPPKLSEEEEQRILDNAKNTFGSLGLYVVEGERYEREPITASPRAGASEEEFPGASVKIFYVAKEREKADKIAELFSANEPESNDEIGKLSGYPESAIRAYREFFEEGFKNGLLEHAAFIEQKVLPAETRKQDFMAFAQFRLSKDNWRKELETAKRWADAIKKTDPALYEREVAGYKKSIAGEEMDNETKMSNFSEKGDGLIQFTQEEWGARSKVINEKSGTQKKKKAEPKTSDTEATPFIPMDMNIDI